MAMERRARFEALMLSLAVLLTGYLFFRARRRALVSLLMVCSAAAPLSTPIRAECEHVLWLNSGYD